MSPAWKRFQAVLTGRLRRYIGLAKTSLQEACTAAAINVTRIVRWLGGLPRAKTRVTRFAALAKAA